MIYKYYLHSLAPMRRVFFPEFDFGKVIQQFSTVQQLMGVNRAFVLRDTPVPEVTKTTTKEEEEELREEDVAEEIKPKVDEFASGKKQVDIAEVINEPAAPAGRKKK